MIPSPETQTKITQWRQRAREGTMSQQDMIEAITYLRGERTGAVASSRTPASRIAKPVVNTDDLLAELGL